MGRDGRAAKGRVGISSIIGELSRPARLSAIWQAPVPPGKAAARARNPALPMRISRPAWPDDEEAASRKGNYLRTLQATLLCLAAIAAPALATAEVGAPAAAAPALPLPPTAATPTAPAASPPAATAPAAPQPVPERSAPPPAAAAPPPATAPGGKASEARVSEPSAGTAYGPVFSVRMPVGETFVRSFEGPQ